MVQFAEKRQEGREKDFLVVCNCFEMLFHKKKDFSSAFVRSAQNQNQKCGQCASCAGRGFFLYSL